MRRKKKNLEPNGDTVLERNQYGYSSAMRSRLAVGMAWMSAIVSLQKVCNTFWIHNALHYWRPLEYNVLGTETGEMRKRNDMTSSSFSAQGQHR